MWALDRKKQNADYGSVLDRDENGRSLRRAVFGVQPDRSLSTCDNQAPAFEKV